MDDDYEITLPQEEEAAATLARPLVDTSKILLILDSAPPALRQVQIV